MKGHQPEESDGLQRERTRDHRPEKFDRSSPFEREELEYQALQAELGTLTGALDSLEKPEQLQLQSLGVALDTEQPAVDRRMSLHVLLAVGVHLGSEDLAMVLVRRMVGSRRNANRSALSSPAAPTVEEGRNESSVGGARERP